MKRIAVMTSGGDSPGMNAALRAVVRSAIFQGLEVYGIYRGYEGLLDREIERFGTASVGGIINRGGTILRTARSQRFKTPEGLQQAAAILQEYGIDGLVVIGGDGSLRGAGALNELMGIQVMGLPGTIDNDIPGTDYSIGFDTAVNTALDAIDKIRDTAYSHERIFVIEVMGRRNGSIALEVALAGGAEAVLVPEVPYSIQNIIKRLQLGYQHGKKSSIIIVAEGASRAEDVKTFIEKHTGYDARAIVLGHLQRGGSPTAFDRTLATRLGCHAIHRLLSGNTNEMVGVEGNRLVAHPVGYILSSTKSLDASKLELIEMMAS